MTARTSSTPTERPDDDEQIFTPTQIGAALRPAIEAARDFENAFRQIVEDVERSDPDDLPIDATERWARGGLSPEKLRTVGVPGTLMSDFEFMGALFRDSQYDGHEGQPEVMGGYDRRGLLNVIAWLVNHRG